MKRTIIYLLLLSDLSLGASRAAGQVPPRDSALFGEYRAGEGLNLTLEVYLQNNQLMLEIVGQGTTTLRKLSPLVYEPEHIRPKATMSFLQDSTGRISAIRFLQTGRVFTWQRIRGERGGYSGDFKLQDNPYRVLHIN